MKSRLTAILLAICLIAGLLPAPALAAGGDSGGNFQVISKREYAVAPGVTGV